ncbi:MAG: MBL fold metallo-hydrolase [Phycisphaerae bacterium]|jgi:glyoxylase-like metal-dependent hydrolase (beta-lactamase superfamily II)|nr:MBL fold metallo-hydrolase [Phycisphaerae bacterium]
MHTASPPRYDLGGCTVTLVNGGRLRLDGGAMFGLIPKPLWSRACPADEQNRIPLHCNCLLVEWPGPSERRAIIETGHGPKYGDKEQRIFAIDPAHWLLPALVDLGVDPDTITDVIVSHLHFDHAGGLTYERNGEVRPTFPRARVHVQRAELDDARANFGIMTATYREENYAALERAGAWRPLEGAGEIVPGIQARPTPGHTRGHHSIVVAGRDRRLVFAGDLMPTRHHLGAPYNMAYDLFPLENRASKQALLAWLAADHGLLVLDHEVETPVLTVCRKDDWFELQPEAGAAR